MEEKIETEDRQPNEQTLQALEDAKNRENLLSFDTLEELFEDLEI